MLGENRDQIIEINGIKIAQFVSTNKKYYSTSWEKDISIIYVHGGHFFNGIVLVTFKP